MRKTLALVLAAAMALSLGLSAPAMAAGFSDVSGWAEPYIQRASELGLVSGTGGGKFSPSSKVTYAQFATMLCCVGYKGEAKPAASGEAWWMPYCRVGGGHDMFYNTSMEKESNWSKQANQPLSREHMAQMLWNMMWNLGWETPFPQRLEAAKAQITDFSSISKDNAWSVQCCYGIGLISGSNSGKFDPKGTLDRAQAAVILCAAYNEVNGIEPEAAPRPADAVGGHYNLLKYTVPADANKDGWITEAEVQAVIDQLMLEYPTGTHWGSDSYWSSPVLGSGRECAGFAFMVSDKIFGDLPKYGVPINDLRPGDYIRITSSHSMIALSRVGEGKISSMPDYTNPSIFNIAHGNIPSSNGDRVLSWYGWEYADDWPNLSTGTYIWSRYPQE